MKITILTVGSRGDVQPFVALAIGLKNKGHQVHIATHYSFQQFVEDYDLSFRPIIGEVDDVLDKQAVTDILEKGGQSNAFFKHFAKEAHSKAELAFADMWKAAQDANLIIASALTLYPGFFIAQKLNIPLTMASVNPAGPTRAFPHILLPPTPKYLPAKGVYNATSHYTIDNLIWKMVRPIISKGWQALHQESIPKKNPLYEAFEKNPPLLLYGYSPTILPKPQDWATYQHVTGYWFLPAPKNWQAPKKLVDFIAAGEAPIFAGFGSMNKSEKVWRCTIEALKQTKKRCIILGDKKQLANFNLYEDGNFYILNNAPFDWLFPQMSMLIHHGGAGTTAIGVKSGIPNLIIPSIAEQRFWCNQIYKIGAAPKCVHRNKVSTAKIVAAINEMTNNKMMRLKAQQLALKIRQENGVETAANLVHQRYAVPKELIT